MCIIDLVDLLMNGYNPYNPYRTAAAPGQLEQVESAKDAERSTPAYAKKLSRRRATIIIILVIVLILVIIGVIIYIVLKRRAQAKKISTGTVTGTKCLTNSDCLNNKVCQTTTGICVLCLSNNNCSDPVNVCNTSTNKCVACVTHADCANSNGGTCISNTCCINTPPVLTDITLNSQFFSVLGNYTFSQAPSGASAIVQVYESGGTNNTNDVVVYTQPATTNLGTLFVSGLEICGNAPGTVLKIAVAIRSKCGTTAYSNKLSFTVPPLVPRMLSASVFGKNIDCLPTANTIRASWTPVACAISYDILINAIIRRDIAGLPPIILTAFILGEQGTSFDGTAADIDDGDGSDYKAWCTGSYPRFLTRIASVTMSVRARLTGGFITPFSPSIIAAGEFPDIIFGDSPCCIQG